MKAPKLIASEGWPRNRPTKIPIQSSTQHTRNPAPALNPTDALNGLHRLQRSGACRNRLFRCTSAAHTRGPAALRFGRSTQACIIGHVLALAVSFQHHCTQVPASRQAHGARDASFGGLFAVGAATYGSHRSSCHAQGEARSLKPGDMTDKIQARGHTRKATNSAPPTDSSSLIRSSSLPKFLFPTHPSPCPIGSGPKILTQ